MAIIAGVAWFFLHDTNKSETTKFTEALAATAPARDKNEAIFEKDFGDKWAFTFDRAVLICDTGAAYISDQVKDITYPLTGLAQTRIKSSGKTVGPVNLDDVWKDGPQPYGSKINLSPFIDHAFNFVNKTQKTRARRVSLLMFFSASLAIAAPLYPGASVLRKP